MSLPLGEDTRPWRPSGQVSLPTTAALGLAWLQWGSHPPAPAVESGGGRASRAWLLPCRPVPPSGASLQAAPGWGGPHAADPGAAPSTETRVGLHGEPNPIPMGTTTLSTGVAGKGLTADPREGNLYPASGAEGKVGEAGNARKPRASGPLSSDLLGAGTLWLARPEATAHVWSA